MRRPHMAFRLSGGIGDFMVMLGRIARLVDRDGAGRDAIVVIDDPKDEDYARIARDARFLSEVHEVPAEHYPDFLLWGASSHHYGRRSQWVSDLLLSLDADVFDWGNELDRGRLWFESALPRASLTLDDFGWSKSEDGTICVQPVSVWSKGESSLWPDWAEAVTALARRGVLVKIIGGTYDFDTVEETSGGCLSLDGVENLVGKLSLKESVMLVAASTAVMGVESWAALVASEFGVPAWMRMRDDPHSLIHEWREMGMTVDRDWRSFTEGLS